MSRTKIERLFDDELETSLDDAIDYLQRVKTRLENEGWTDIDIEQWTHGYHDSWEFWLTGRRVKNPKNPPITVDFAANAAYT